MKIAIIGGSVGGLLAGIAFKKNGHDVQIYERSALEMQGRGARVLQTEHPFVQAIVDMEVPQMYKGRIVIIGDAASVVRPHTASGTAKAYEDAVTLAYSISQFEHIGDALRYWDNHQMAYAAELIDYGKRLGQGSGLGTY